ncbi:HET domain-containing protein [Microdochium nivale]|nr:HET domain-containing protein [Microdochium nivale]
MVNDTPCEDSLCSTCASLSLDELNGVDVLFHPNLASLQQSAAEETPGGCPLCRLVMASIRKEWKPETVADMLGGQIPTDFRGDVWEPELYITGDYSPEYLTALPHELANGDFGVTVSCPRLKRHPSHKDNIGTVRLDLFVSIHSPLASRIPGRLFTKDHDPDDAYISMIREAWHRCKTSHAICSHDQSHAMPTRVIAILEIRDMHDDQLRLVHCRDDDDDDDNDDSVRGEPYIALSYCWGPPAPTLRLDHGTLTAMTSGFRESALSKAHRDTIHLARALGVKYVWIDALCIIQGDADDWARESMRMASVYGNAALTIIAGRSADARLSFATLPSAQQKSQPQRPPPCLIPLSRTAGGTSTGRETDNLVGVGMLRSRLAGPTTSRGWCFQEDLLSRRVIIFGQAQLTYRCRNGKVFEDGHRGSKNPMADLQLVLHSRNRNRDRIGKTDVVLKTWYSLLDGFTLCHLSNPHDVFGSLAALAALVGSALGGSRYLAGLWEVDLVRGMLWVPRYQMGVYAGTRQDPVTRPQPTALAPGPVVIRAPSWSWASVQGPVVNKNKAGLVGSRYRAEGGGGDLVRVRPALRDSGSGSPSWTSDTHCGVSALHMPSCELRVVGRLRRAHVLGGRVPDDKRKAVTLQVWERRRKFTRALVSLIRDAVVEEEIHIGSGDDTGTWAALGWFDVPNEACDRVWCLELVPDEGMLLIEDSEEAGDRFRRVGLFRLLQLDWFETAPERKFSLI